MPNINKMVEMAGLFNQITQDVIKSSALTEIFFGTVKTVSPISVAIDQKLTLSEKQLVLGSFVSDFQVPMSIDTQTEPETKHTHPITVIDSYTGGGTGSSSPTSHLHDIKAKTTITLHFGLTVGEKVILLRMQGGQKFLVLDRVR